LNPRPQPALEKGVLSASYLIRIKMIAYNFNPLIFQNNHLEYL
jgi:hypothetical protein